MTELHNSFLPKVMRLKEELEQYFIHSSIECPYGQPSRAVYNQALFDTMPDQVMDIYLASGYRRNGNVIYNMHCSGCSACVPLRINPLEFRPDRSQKRIWKKNSDLNVEITPLACSGENLLLLEKFLTTRFPNRKSSALEYYTGFFLNHITTTVEFRYKLGSRLIGVAIVDLSSLWLNVVFFYFDPEAGKRSPGTFNILYLIDFCRQKKIPLVYLGYWIENVRAMRYKARFKPHYLFNGRKWLKVES